MNIPQFLVAAPTSGAGKTTVSCGLMALLRSKNLQVQPYKCGPDYIDTKYHQRACGRPSINLDRFMASDNHIRDLYARYSRGADICVVEGMMGMFDGYQRDRGSSADVARLLGLPVVMVVDARSAAYSMAPLLSGFLHFSPDVQVAGVIFNKVGTERHRLMLSEVCEDLGMTCFGFVPRHEELEQDSRYLGLDFSQPHNLGGELLSLLEENIDWRLMLERTSRPQPEATAEPTAPTPADKDGEPCGQVLDSGCGLPPLLNILVARNDESFSFIYQEHLDLLAQWGDVTYFDPEVDELIPTNIDLLYLPGGYPEKHAGALSRARHTRSSIRNYIARGGRTLAECGGMIYLSQDILFDDMTPDHGLREPMARALPFSISCMKAHRRLSLGYRQFTYAGQLFKGHEFHYTQLLPPEDNDQLPPSVTQVLNARGGTVNTPVFRHKNTLASYTHLYWGESDILRIFDTEK